MEWDHMLSTVATRATRDEEPPCLTIVHTMALHMATLPCRLRELHCAVCGEPGPAVFRPAPPYMHHERREP
jgi:hypothetical protein